MSERSFADDVASGRRFKFGNNWSRFLSVLNDDRVAEAESSLREMLGVESLVNRRFLDAGSGSGLFSLAARRLGARVHSFDFDPQSVACTVELRRRFFDGDSEWTIDTGSVLDSEYLSSLGSFDVVYSWGVLHHTGNMWLGIQNVIGRLAPGGMLFVAIYNDQGWKSHVWWLVKAAYNGLPRPLSQVYGYTIGYASLVAAAAKHLILLRPRLAWQVLTGAQGRGMSRLHDMLDWVGGFPFEFATYEALERYLWAGGLALIRGKRATSTGCHEMVFRRRQP